MCTQLSAGRTVLLLLGVAASIGVDVVHGQGECCPILQVI